MSTQTYKLSSGNHETFDPQECGAMELAAHLAGLPHSDAPSCTSKVIAVYVRRLNDCMPEAVRNEFLLPVIPRLLGTADLDDQKLAYIAADWAVRVFAVSGLNAVGQTEHADRLRSLSPITDIETADAAADAVLAAADSDRSVSTAPYAYSSAANAVKAAHSADAARLAVYASADAAHSADAARLAVYASADAAHAAGHAARANSSVWSESIKLLEAMLAA